MTAATPAVPATPAQDLAALSGQVRNAMTGEPLRKAQISLNRVDAAPTSGPRSFSGWSGADGRFTITGIEPGRYRAVASHGGFLNMDYNARRPGSPGTNLTLDRAQKVSGVEFRLTPHGVIAGHIVDEDGDPMENMQVQLLRVEYNQARRQLLQAGAAASNDLGEFRLFGIEPGKYYLEVVVRGRFGPMGQAGPENPAQLDYVTTFYPNVADVAAASPIEVKPGGHVEGIQFRLTKAQTVRVRGRMVNNVVAGAPAAGVLRVGASGPSGGVAANTLAGATVRMLPRNTLNPQWVNLTAPAAGDGTFEFPSVAPGAYMLIAQVTSAGGPHSVRMPLDVAHTNVEGVTLTVNPGSPITGTVRLDNGTGQLPGNLMIRLAYRDPVGGNLPPPAKVDGTGAFRLDEIDAENYNVIVGPLPEGYYVKSIRAGNTDVLTNGLDLTAGPAGALDVVIGPGAPQVSGMVQNPAAQGPAPAVRVVLIPEDKSRREQSRFYFSTTSDENGHFTLRQVIPGGYRAYAFEDAPNGAWYDPDFIKAVESKGEPLTVREGMNSAISLNMIPAN